MNVKLWQIYDKSKAKMWLKHTQKSFKVLGFKNICHSLPFRNDRNHRLHAANHRMIKSKGVLRGILPILPFAYEQRSYRNNSNL